jgi:hypothetical protein
MQLLKTLCEHGKSLPLQRTNNSKLSNNAA